MKKLTIQLDDDTNAKLKAIAKADGRSVMRYIQKMIEAHVAKAEKSNA